MKKNSWLLCFIVFILFTSCYKNVEGCLDTYASNFDVSADKECTACCVFPSIKFEINSVNGDSSYTIADTIVNNLHHKFKIIEGKFYISGISIVDENKIYKTNKNIKDSLTNAAVLDDVILFRVQDKSVALAGFKYFGAPDSISFGIGLRDSLYKGIFPNIELSHPLSSRNILQDTTTEKTAVVSIKWVNIDTNKADTLHVLMTGSPQFYPKTFSHVNPNKLGSDIVIKAECDYSVLFQDITPSMKLEEAEAKFRKNILSFFYVK